MLSHCGPANVFENNDQGVRAISSRIDLLSGWEDPLVRIDHDNASIASHAVFDNTGTLLLTSLEGNRQVVVSDANANHELVRFDVGKAPQGLIVSEDNKRLYVHNFTDRTIGIYNISNLTSGRSLYWTITVVSPGHSKLHRCESISLRA